MPRRTLPSKSCNASHHCEAGGRSLAGANSTRSTHEYLWEGSGLARFLGLRGTPCRASDAEEEKEKEKGRRREPQREYVITITSSPSGAGSGFAMG